jgi:hypothetical protein
MFVDSKDWVITYEECEKRAPGRYEEPLKSLTVGHQWQQVVMDISYMPKMEYGYHLVVIACKSFRESGEAWPPKERLIAEVVDLFYHKVICQFRYPGVCGSYC